MSPIDRVRQRYFDDATFRALVDTIRHCVETLQLTPSETREAAMLASIMFEERRVPTVRIEPCGDTFACYSCELPKRHAGNHRDGLNAWGAADKAEFAKKWGGQ